VGRPRRVREARAAVDGAEIRGSDDSWKAHRPHIYLMRRKAEALNRLATLRTLISGEPTGVLRGPARRSVRFRAPLSGTTSTVETCIGRVPLLRHDEHVRNVLRRRRNRFSLIEHLGREKLQNIVRRTLDKWRQVRDTVTEAVQEEPLHAFGKRAVFVSPPRAAKETGPWNGLRDHSVEIVKLSFYEVLDLHRWLDAASSRE
jgi:hypothetical protein